MGLNLLTGYNGQVSIGHGAFFGVGAYTTRDPHARATGSARSLADAAVAGRALCFVVGALVGFPALRVKGLYLALVTLGLAVIFPDLANRFVKGTGGTSLVALDAERARARRRGVREVRARRRRTSGPTTTRSASRCVGVARRVVHRAQPVRPGADRGARPRGGGRDRRHRPRPHEGAGVRAQRAVRGHRGIALGARLFTGQRRQGRDVPALDRVPRRAS